MRSFRSIARRPDGVRLRALTFAVGVAVSLGMSGTAHARVVVTNTVATPISPTSLCTAEPRDAIYGNLTFDPLKYVDFFNGINLPSAADMTANLPAGATSDFCVGYTLTPDFTPGERRAAYTVQPSDPVDPETHFDDGDDQKDITVTLPAGYAGALAAVPTCSSAEFGIDAARYYESNPYPVDYPDPASFPVGAGRATCAANTQIGTAMVRVSTNVLDNQVELGPSRPGAPYGLCGSRPTSPATCSKSTWIYNLEPGPNELGRLGVQLLAGVGMYTPTKFTVSLRLAPDGSGRVQAVVNDAPRLSNYDTPGLYVEGVAMHMWGSVADHPSMAADFSQNGTSCSVPSTADVDVTTHGGPPVFDPTTYFVLPDPTTYVPSVSHMASAAYTHAGCDQVPFAPSVSVSAAERRPGTPTAVDVAVNVDQAQVGGILPSTLKDAVVTMPAGIEIGAQVASDADGLTLCSAAQFAPSNPTVPAGCPAATRAGTVAITSPLIGRQLVGDVFLGEQAAVGDLPDLYLEATLAGATAPDAPRIKLVGSVSAAADGRLTASFLNNPQLRFSELELSFPGGDHALFATAPRCGSSAGSARMSPWSGQPDVEVATSAVVIDEGCGAAAAPSISVAASNPKAGAKSPVSVTIERDASAPWMDSVNAHLPAGFLADLNAAAECPAVKAAVGDCSADSRIGTVTTWAGAGTKPFEIAGELFLAERNGTDVAGAVIVVDAKVGDLDLGKVIVPGRILLRPTDAGLDFISDVPLRVEGVALQLQKVRVDLDRPNFALNPSACGPLEASVELTDDQSVVTTGTGTATYTGCKELGFTPKLQAILTGDNTPGGHPGMYVVLTSPEGDAGMKSAAVTLPDGVVADLANTKNTCTVAQFNASACPATAKIGSAKAEVSIVPEQLTGSIFMVAIPGKSLPGLGLDFGGRYAQRVLSTVSTDKDSRLVTTFAAIPDLPLRRLVIDVASSPKSPLQISETSPCDANSGWQGVFTAQGGQSSTSKSGLQCAAQPKTTLSAKAGLSFRLFDFGTRNLNYLKVSLPKGWSLNAKAATKQDAVWVRATGGSATVKLAKRSLFVYATGKTTDVRFKVSAAVLKGPRKLKKGSKITLPVRLAFTDGTIQQQTISLKLK